MHICTRTSGIGGGLLDFIQIFFFVGELCNQFTAELVVGQELFYNTRD